MIGLKNNKVCLHAVEATFQGADIRFGSSHGLNRGTDFAPGTTLDLFHAEQHAVFRTGRLERGGDGVCFGRRDFGLLGWGVIDIGFLVLPAALLWSHGRRGLHELILLLWVKVSLVDVCGGGDLRRRLLRLDPRL